MSAKRILQTTLCVLLISTGTTYAHAARIYQLVNYPDLQNGHTLSGTITTTDDAPNDGLLDLAEILDWEWEVSDGLEVTIGEMHPKELDSSSFTEVGNIEINSQGLYLPRELGSVLVLEIGTNLNSRGYNTHTLAWTSIFQDFSSRYALSSIIGGDGLKVAWLTELPEDQHEWLIATIVPEPSGLALSSIGIGCATALLCRRKKLSPRRARNRISTIVDE